MTEKHASRRHVASGSGPTLLSSQPSSPPASPHRAGHYSGLHPEDQPFQSSYFLRVRRPTAPESSVPAEHASLESERAQSSLTLRQAPERQLPQRLYTKHALELADIPTPPPRHLTPAPETPAPARPVPRHSPQRGRVIPVLITTSLICFLMASGLLAFLLLSKGSERSVMPQLLAAPGELRVGDLLHLTGSGFHAHSAITVSQDAQSQVARTTTDNQGAFHLPIPITASWSVGVHTLHATDASLLSATTSLTIAAALAGPPRLQLGVSRVDLGAGQAGTLSQKNITLTNEGGGQVDWQARSDAPWLLLDPSHGTFMGSAALVLTVNRTNLSPQAYLSQIVFTQDRGVSQVLYVAMTVNTTPANLGISTASLAFTGTPAQSPAGQNILIQNSGGQALNWTAGSTTTDSSNWLNVTPAGGVLNARTSAVLTVTVNTLKMAPGSYQGTLSFSYAGGSSQQIAIALTVNPPPQPVLQLTTTSLSFTTRQGFDPPAQNFTISNPGNAPLNWTIHEDTYGQSYLNISPPGGSISPGQHMVVTIAPTLGSANGTINSTLTILDSDAGTHIPGQQVNVSIAITNEPVITLEASKLEFDHNNTFTDTSELLIFSNTGSLPLNWTLTASAQVPWLLFDTISGTLAASSPTYINIHCISAHMKPGTYTVTVTIKDSDAGTAVAPQTVTVTLIVTG